MENVFIVIGGDTVLNFLIYCYDMMHFLELTLLYLPRLTVRTIKENGPES